MNKDFAPQALPRERVGIRLRSSKVAALDAIASRMKVRRSDVLRTMIDDGIKLHYPYFFSPSNSISNQLGVIPEFGNESNEVRAAPSTEKKSVVGDGSQKTQSSANGHHQQEKKPPAAPPTQSNGHDTAEEAEVEDWELTMEF